MPCHAMHPMQDYFWKVFHKYYNLICIFICTPICTKFLFLQKVGVTERPMTDQIRCICQVVEAPAPRWTFEAGMREAASEALAVLRHEADERMTQSQYRHFLSQAEEGE
jgi:hypothetical protein